MANISEQVLEIRYKPNAKILDLRGTWAEAISEHIALPEWRIIENRVDVFDKDFKERAFVGFRNAGYVVHDAPTNNFFLERAAKYVKHLFSLTGFGKNIYVERIGIRLKICFEFSGTFDELLNKYETNYLSLSAKAKNIFKAELKDMSGPLDFQDSHGNFNTLSGPITMEQMPQYFEGKKELPTLGLFFDIDYWCNPKEKFDEKETLKKIDHFCSSIRVKVEGLYTLIMDDKQ